MHKLTETAELAAGNNHCESSIHTNEQRGIQRSERWLTKEGSMFLDTQGFLVCTNQTLK